MRLGKEQAVGYVEDTGFSEDTATDAAQPQEIVIGRHEQMPLTTVPEPSLTAR
jgi:hypothetical protein